MQEIEYEYDSMIIDDEVEDVVIDYTKIKPYAPDIKYDYGTDNCIYGAIHQLEGKVKSMTFSNSRESEYHEKEIFVEDEEITQFVRNDLKEIDLPYTLLESQINSVLTVVDKENARNVFADIQNEWMCNGARSILTNWTGLGDGEEDVDFDKVRLMHTYRTVGLKIDNKYLYEMYAYLLELEEQVGFRLIWAKHWRSMKFLMSFYQYDYRKNYSILLRLCDDRFFQQYINLVSIVFDWGLIFSFPYVEKYKRVSNHCESQMITMTPNLDSVGDGVNEGKMSTIGVKQFSVSGNCLQDKSKCREFVVNVEYDIAKVLVFLSAVDIVSAALVSKGWYSRVESYTAHFKNYVDYLGQYAFGMGMRKICPLRQSHSLNSPYNGTFFGRKLYHENYDCDECFRNIENFELDRMSDEIDPDRTVVGYNAILYVNCDMVIWLESVMKTLPMKYRSLYDRLFCVTPGHFACVYECIMFPSQYTDFVSRFIKFYDKDFLFHMLLPFVPGALNWSWLPGSKRGREWRRYEEPD